MKKLVFAALSGLALVACGGGGGAGSCKFDGVASSGYESYCVEYGSTYTVDSVKAACSTGTYSSGACEAGDKCTYNKGTSTEYSWTYVWTSDATADQKAAVKTACSGEWTAK